MRLQSFVTCNKQCKMYKTTSVVIWNGLYFIGSPGFICASERCRSVPFNTGLGQANVVIRYFLWIKALIFLASIHSLNTMSRVSVDNVNLHSNPCIGEHNLLCHQAIILISVRHFRKRNQNSKEITCLVSFWN